MCQRVFWRQSERDFFFNWCTFFQIMLPSVNCQQQNKWNKANQIKNKTKQKSPEKSRMKVVADI